MARKTLVLALVAGYFFVVNCRFACALTMSDQAVAIVESHEEQPEAGSCHHHEDDQQKSSGQSKPCCMTQMDGSLALLPGTVALLDASLIVTAVPLIGSTQALLPVQPRALWRITGPPLAPPKDLATPTRSPRAPPSPTVVL